MKGDTKKKGWVLKLRGVSCEGGQVFTHLETPTDGDKGSFGTSEGSAATSTQKTKHREFGTEINANWHLPAEKLF